MKLNVPGFDNSEFRKTLKEKKGKRKEKTVRTSEPEFGEVVESMTIKGQGTVMKVKCAHCSRVTAVFIPEDRRS